jgi:hypothetical protein
MRQIDVDADGSGAGASIHLISEPEGPNRAVIADTLSEISDRIDDESKSDVQVAVNSLEAQVGYGSLLRELQHTYLKNVAYHRSEEGGAKTIDEARALAYRECKDRDEAKRIFDRMMAHPVDKLSFRDLYQMWPSDPTLAENIWEMIKQEASDNFESGHFATDAVFPAPDMRTAWNLATYLGIRESFVAEWQPRGGIELSLIDMLAQSFFQHQYWMKETVRRTRTRPREPTPEYVMWYRTRYPGQEVSGFGLGSWNIPFVTEQAATEHAAQMVDRWNRIYIRTLRNLRDLRRYSTPVTINNPQQVNIAAEGGRQLNVSDSGDPKK